mgnify:CR=1 FL=1
MTKATTRASAGSLVEHLSDILTAEIKLCPRCKAAMVGIGIDLCANCFIWRRYILTRALSWKLYLTGVCLSALTALGVRIWLGGAQDAARANTRGAVECSTTGAWTWELEPHAGARGTCVPRAGRPRWPLGRFGRLAFAQA